MSRLAILTAPAPGGWTYVRPGGFYAAPAGPSARTLAAIPLDPDDPCGGAALGLALPWSRRYRVAVLLHGPLGRSGWAALLGDLAEDGAEIKHVVSPVFHLPPRAATGAEHDVETCVPSPVTAEILRGQECFVDESAPLPVLRRSLTNSWNALSDAERRAFAKKVGMVPAGRARDD